MVSLCSGIKNTVAQGLVMNCTIIFLKHPCPSLYAFHHVLTSLKMATISVWSFRKTPVCACCIMMCAMALTDRHDSN